MEAFHREIKLPPPIIKGSISLEEALQRRHSVRHYLSEPLTLQQLSQILWAAQGLRDDLHRTAPSAGGTYPLELFALVGENGVQDLDAGIYHYLVKTHSLELKLSGDKREGLYQAALHQRFILEAPISLILCACYERTCAPYGKRGEKYVHFEVGHAGQNVHLQVETLGLGTVMVGAFRDAEVAELLELPPELTPLYIMPIGKPKPL